MRGGMPAELAYLFLVFDIWYLIFLSMSILVINSGSTSIKYKLFDAREKEIKQGIFEKVTNHTEILKLVLRQIGDLREVKAVGHRVVHGGHKFTRPVIVNQQILNELSSFNDLAPLHNPYNLAGIKLVADFLPELPQVAVFDTAFFASLPPLARLYGLPTWLAEKYQLYRYGFHGISHHYCLQEAARQLKREEKTLNLITCHLGGGWSITAIKAGQAIETSMGLTPLGGLMMMTRAGDLDPGIILKLLKVLPGEINTDKVSQLDEILNNQSGFKGLTGSADFQQILKQLSLGDEQAKLAFDLAIGRLVKYLGAYWLVLEGRVDALVLTGAIGAGNPFLRQQLASKIKCLGKLPVLAVKPDEELMIARQVSKLIK